MSPLKATTTVAAAAAALQNHHHHGLRTADHADHDRVVAFTTPSNYASRLRHLLQLRRRWRPLWCPTVAVEPTHQTKTSLLRHFRTLDEFSAVAFTSRMGIAAVSELVGELDAPPLGPVGETLTLAALGRDSELLSEGFVSKICRNPTRIRVLVPPIASPAAMVESLGFGGGRRILCPVPLVVDLEEPPVVPAFLRDLAANGWAPVSVPAYETRWAGPRCAETMVGGGKREGLDAIIFTSTAEVEGLLKSLGEIGWDWAVVRRRFPGLLVAAHGPVTAAGAERLGVKVDIVSSKFESFDGIVDGLASKWQIGNPD